MNCKCVDSDNCATYGKREHQGEKSHPTNDYFL